MKGSWDIGGELPSSRQSDGPVWMSSILITREAGRQMRLREQIGGFCSNPATAEFYPRKVTRDLWFTLTSYNKGRCF